MVHYCREVISCIFSEENKAFLADFDKKNSHPDLILEESIENVEVILQLLTKLLQKETINDQNMKQIINANAAGQLIIDIISLGRSDGISSGSSSRIKEHAHSHSPVRTSSSLLDRALQCGIELLRGGHNVTCQRILFRYLQTPPHAQQFFESVQKRLVLPCSSSNFNSNRGEATSVAMSAAGEQDARGGRGRGEGGAVPSPQQQQHALLRDGFPQLTALLHFLQLLCEGHYLDMQNLIFTQASFMHDCVRLFLDLVRRSLSRPEHFFQINALVLMRLLDLFTEVVQGPCLKNQELLLKNEGFITALDQLASYHLPAASIVWDDVPLQCLRLEVLQDTNNEMETVGQAKFVRLLNFAELKGIKNKILLLQISLLEGRQLTSSDAAKFMTLTLKERYEAVSRN